MGDYTTVKTFFSITSYLVRSRDFTCAIVTTPLPIRYSACQCLYHVARSTPTTALLALGGVVTVVAGGAGLCCLLPLKLPRVRSAFITGGQC